MIILILSCAWACRLLQPGTRGGNREKQVRIAGPARRSGPPVPSSGRHGHPSLSRARPRRKPATRACGAIPASPRSRVSISPRQLSSAKTRLSADSGEEAFGRPGVKVSPPSGASTKHALRVRRSAHARRGSRWTPRHGARMPRPRTPMRSPRPSSATPKPPRSVSLSSRPSVPDIAQAVSRASPIRVPGCACTGRSDRSPAWPPQRPDGRGLGLDSCYRHRSHPLTGGHEPLSWQAGHGGAGVPFASTWIW